MTRVIEVATQSVRVPVSRARIRHTAEYVLRAERVRDALLSITFVTARRMAALNWTHLRHRGSTDVISFGFSPDGASATVVGDVYIAPEVARRNAREHGEAVREEVLRLVVHGVLHVLGHEHPTDASRYTSAMWHRQERLLRSAVRSA